MKIIPSILNIKSCASLDEQVLKDLEAAEPQRTIAELLDKEKKLFIPTEEKTDNEYLRQKLHSKTFWSETARQFDEATGGQLYQPCPNPTNYY